MILLEKKPKDYIEIDEVMSNFDYSIDKDVEIKLIKEDVYSQYSGWNFCGYVWFDKTDELFKCEVWRYRSHIETFEAPTLKELKDDISWDYGCE